MTTQEKIAIMQAFVDGKQIEFKEKHDKIWEDVYTGNTLLWNWEHFDYRIKPEPKEPTYRPYKNFSEFKADWDKHGGWAKDDRDCSYVMLHSFECDIVECIKVHFTWADDGSPCGVKVED